MFGEQRAVQSDFGTRVCAHARVCMRVGGVYGAVGIVQSGRS